MQEKSSPILYRKKAGAVVRTRTGLRVEPRPGFLGDYLPRVGAEPGSV